MAAGPKVKEKVLKREKPEEISPQNTLLNIILATFLGEGNSMILGLGGLGSRHNAAAG